MFLTLTCHSNRIVAMTMHELRKYPENITRHYYHKMFIALGIAAGFGAASIIFPIAIAGSAVALEETGRNLILGLNGTFENIFQKIDNQKDSNY